MSHEPVLLKEVIEHMQIIPDGVYVDATFGRGGHSRAVLEALGPTGRLLVMDKDPTAILSADALAEVDKRVSVRHASFTELSNWLDELDLNGKIDGVLMDLGVSSPQLDDPRRGFSFRRDGPLDMRMDPTSGHSAAEWLARASEADIADVLRTYGEERYAKRIARAIVFARKEKAFETTTELADVVKQANPKWERHKHPATRAFQAIRIFINRELDELADGLQQAFYALKKGGRLSVISFHSLEDRMVKNFMRDKAKGLDVPREIPLTESQLNIEMNLIAKGIKADEREVKNNPRARSAVLRVGERR